MRYIHSLRISWQFYLRQNKTFPFTDKEPYVFRCTTQDGWEGGQFNNQPINQSISRTKSLDRKMLLVQQIEFKGYFEESKITNNCVLTPMHTLIQRYNSVLALAIYHIEIHILFKLRNVRL